MFKGLLFLIPLFIVYVFFCTTEDTELHRVFIFFIRMEYLKELRATLCYSVVN